ncbi:endo-1,4-beta-xylanase [Rubripirellula amarantea]|nr:endo-1,4-beta-xylanase [Rubripirellula amarantea]
MILERLEDRRLLAAGNGLQAQYFNNENLNGTAFIRLDPTVDFDWGSGSPDSSIASDTFSARWSGQVEAEFTENYEFFASADGGVRLWVNGQLMFDSFDDNGFVEAVNNIDLIAGRRYDVQLEYREVSGVAAVSLEWSSSSLPREVVPTGQLFASQRGSVTTETWNDVSGSDIVSLTSLPNFPSSPTTVENWNSIASVNDNTTDNYGRRIRGYIHAPQSGNYQFYVAANETSQLWLSASESPDHLSLIASTNVATSPQDWTASASQQSDTIVLAAGQKYYFELLHKEGVGDDHLAVGWTTPTSSTVTLIGRSDLSPVVPEVRIYSESPYGAELAGVPAKFTIVRESGPTNLPLEVFYSTSGTANNGVDYQSLSGSIIIPSGSLSVDLNITPLTDTLDEGPESVVIELQNGPGYEVGFTSERTVYGTIYDDAAAPSGGTSLWTGTQLADFTRFGGTYTTESDPTFGSVIQAAILSQPATQYSAQIRQAIDAPVTQGDILFAEFAVRSTTGPGELTAIFELGASPYTKSLSQQIQVGSDWTKIQMPFIAAGSYAVGQATFGFHLGFQIQTLQFTDFQLLNYGPPKSLASETDFFLSGAGTWGTSQLVPVAGEPFGFAYEVTTSAVPPNPWNLQAQEKNDYPVQSGDTLRFEFSVRATSGNNPITGFVLQTTDTYANLVSQSINLSSNWQHFTIDYEVGEDFATESLQAVFNIGQKLQTVEIGGFHWTNLSNSVNFEDLPEQFPASSYEGRLGTDAWRESADSRIETDRMSLATVQVVDGSGNPLDGAVIHLRQKEHEFLFGSAINAFNGKLDPNGNTQALKYQSEINRLFNTVVMENSLKWPQYLNDPQRAIDAVNFANSNDLYVRGHNMIWPSRGNMPSSIWNEYDTRVITDGSVSAAAWLETTIENHLADLLTTFNGQVPEWDVVNEPYTNHDVMDILGDSIVVDWFQQVRDYDPTIKLVLNDYHIFTSNGSDTAHRVNFDNWLTTLSNAGLLDVIGVQNHYGAGNLTDIVVLEQLVNSYYTQFNTPIVITEFDVNTEDEQLQADYLRDYFTMAFSQNEVSEILQWGFWEDSHWLPNSALYRSDFSIKPNGQAYEDLVFGRWWSDVRGTSSSGAFSTDVFRGDYEVVVEYGGNTFTTSLVVDSSDTASATVTVPTQLVDAIDDSVVTNQDTPVDISVLLNDLPAGETKVVSAVDGTHGTTSIGPGGVITYTPNVGFSGSDSFQYTIALQDVELVNSAVSGGDRFGNSVAVSGDFAVVGSFLDDPAGLNSAGSAFVYQRTGNTSWTQVAQLTGDGAPNGTDGQFGYSVAIDGDTVAVSAQKDRENGFQAGAVYIFDRNEGGPDNWGRVTKLIGSDTVKRDLFGRSVDISGDTIVVGASVADPVGVSSGAAYVFERDQGGVDTWGQVKKLTGSTQGAGDRFGQSVSIDENYVAVGAFRYDGVGNDSGAAYVFARNSGGVDNWGEVAVVEASDGSAADQFGFSVSIEGNNLAVAAPLDDEAGMNQLGSVYLFNASEGGSDNWGQVTKLLANDGVAGDRLGLSVSIDGDRIIAGSPLADGGGNASGRAYVFENVAGSWSQSRVLINDKVTTADEYGIAVATDGEVAIIGSWLDNRPNNNTGGAYAFDLQTDIATVSVTVGSASLELLLTQSITEPMSISSESAEPVVQLDSRRVLVEPLSSPTLTRDHVLAVGFADPSDDELEGILNNIANDRLSHPLAASFDGIANG